MLYRSLDESWWDSAKSSDFFVDNKLSLCIIKIYKH